MVKLNNVIQKIFLSLIIFITFSEWGLRLFKEQVRIFYPAGKTFPPIYAQCDIHSLKLRPNIDEMHYNYFNEFVKRYHVNAKGLRGYTEDGDIVMLGDSFVFGVGLNDDETIPYYLEKMSGIKVVNAGVPGYSVDDEYVLLRKYGPQKIAIVSFFFGNDIDEIKDHEWAVDGDGLPLKIVNKTVYIDDYGHMTARGAHVSPLKEFLRNNSFFYTVLSENRYKFKWKIEALGQMFGEIGRKTLPQNMVKHFKEDESAIKIKHLFYAMKKTNSKFLVLLIPTRTPDTYETEYMRYITGFFENEKIKYICLPNQPASLYYNHDCHLTNVGAKHAAGLVYQKLKDLCWL